MGHYANECPNPRKSQDYVPLCGNCKTAGHPTDECPEPKKDEREWKTGKHVRIQDDKEDRGSRNVNHVQHTIHRITPHPGTTVNAVTTRSKRVVDPLPVPDDNSDEKSLSYESQTNGDPLIHVSPTQIKAKGAVNSTPTVIQPVPVVAPVTLPQQDLHSKFLGLTKASVVATRPRHETVKLPPYKVMNPGSSSKKTTSRRTRVMELATGLQHYDIISDLDNIKPQITMRQLLAIAPHCRSKLTSSMIRKKPKMVDIHDVTLSKDPGAPAVDVIIDGVLIPGFQVDTGSSVNLMSVETLNELGITKMNPTPIILKMAYHTRTKPLGELPQVSVIVAGKEYKIDFIVFRTSDAIQPIPGILGRPWLILPQAKEDWGKGILTLGRESEKMIMPLFPTKYQGETQDNGTEFSSDGSNSETDYPLSEAIHNVKSHSDPISLGMGEYYFPLGDGDSDDAILQWQKSVCNIVTTIAPKTDHPPQPLDKGKASPFKKPEVPLASEEDWEDAMFSSSTPIKSYVSNCVGRRCCPRKTKTI